MKKLIISVKSANQALDEVTNRLAVAQKRRGKVAAHFEISFTDMKQFKKFLGNVDVLTFIQMFRPKSIYELAQLMKRDVANMNRLIAFFEEIGAIQVKDRVVKGRTVRTPIVEYRKIEVDLAA